MVNSDLQPEEQAGTPHFRKTLTNAKTVFAVSVGNTLEWFDWTVFAIFATYFSSQFFHSGNHISNLLSTMAVFAVGFVMRPLGGLVFGLIADRRGRRFVMVATMSLVAVASMLIAFGPTYGQIGAFASLWLLVMRCVHGLAHGGEMGGSYTYMAEIARPERRALWGSAITVSTVAGTLLATLLGAVLRLWVDEQAMMSWGWRVPFLLGGLLGLVALYLRRGLNEPEVFVAESGATAGESRAQARRRSLRGMWESRGMILRVVVIVGGTSIYSYTWSTNAPAYATNFLKVDDRAALWVGVLANLIFIAALPFAALLADRIGRRVNVMLWGIGVAALSYPLFRMLDDTATSLLIAMSLALVVQSLAAGPQVAWFAELFSTTNRATSVGVAVSIAAAIFGGTAPYLNSWLTSRGTPDMFIWYVIVLALAVAVAAYFSPETKGVELTDGADAAETEKQPLP